MYSRRVLVSLFFGLLTFLALPVYGQNQQSSVPSPSIHLTYLTGFPLTKLGAPLTIGVGAMGILPLDDRSFLALEGSVTTFASVFVPSPTLTVGGGRNYGRFGIVLNGLYKFTPGNGDDPLTHVVGGTFAPSILIVPGIRVVLPVAVTKPLWEGPVGVTLAFKVVVKAF
ncbi:TPA: hypothetical protein DCW61_04010 [Candidatus Uhrbacteria bacterium]|nr:hypothetical protein [Candidatus Uhrbacteria bacterium]